MMASRFASQLRLDRRSQAQAYWQDGHAANGRKAAASARVGRSYKTYPAGNRLETARIVAVAPFGGVFMKYSG